MYGPNSLGPIWQGYFVGYFSVQAYFTGYRKYDPPPKLVQVKQKFKSKSIKNKFMFRILS
jgi:hypothetical protein